MALSSSSSPSRNQLDFTTTTLFADPTSLGSHPPASTSVPVAAIAGGSSAGVVLAILAVVGWRYWGRQIKKREREQLEKRKAVHAAIAYRRSVLSGGRKRAISKSDHSRRSRQSPSDRKVKFAGDGLPAPTTSTTTPDKISFPRPLQPRTSEKDGFPLPANASTRFRAGLLDGKSYKPLHPSPLAAPPSPRTPDLESQPQTPMATDRSSNDISGTSRAPASSGRIPRLKASLSSLTGEARRQSKASQNSASDQSRHSSAGGSAPRWSWWSLINNPGVSLRQIGVGTGKNRLSADTSLYEDWQEEDPSVPIGYAYSGIDEDLRKAKADNDDQNGHVFPSWTEVDKESKEKS